MKEMSKTVYALDYLALSLRKAYNQFLMKDSCWRSSSIHLSSIWSMLFRIDSISIWLWTICREEISGFNLEDAKDSPKMWLNFSSAAFCSVFSTFTRTISSIGTSSLRIWSLTRKDTYDWLIWELLVCSVRITTRIHQGRLDIWHLRSSTGRIIRFLSITLRLES